MEKETMFRVAFGVILLVNLFISGFFRRRARATGATVARRDESGTMILMRLTIALPLVVSFIVYLAYPAGLAWVQLPFPGWLRWAGVALGVVTIGGSLWVFTSIGRNVSETILTKADHALITHGPYRWVRHPLYTNGLLLITALGIIAANGLILAMVVAGFAAIAELVVPKEERELIHHFGEAYRHYQTYTGRFMPRILHRPSSA